MASITPAPGGVAEGARVLRALLLIDCGAAFTKVALVGLVEDHYRLLARAQAATTMRPPEPDVLVGVRDALALIERVTGRRLLRDGQLIVPMEADGGGVDAAAATISAAGPLRLLTTGPGREAVAALLHRALAGLFVQLDTPPAGAPPAPSGMLTETPATSSVRALRPHGILVVGAPFAGARVASTTQQTLDAVSGWVAELRDERTEQAGPRGVPVLFTGSAEEGQALSAALQRQGALVAPVEALSPAMLAPLGRAVGALYERTVLHAMPGYSVLRAQLAAPSMASCTALGGIVRYLAQHYQMNVIGVDVGASATALAAATAQGDFVPAIHPNAGVGAGAGHVVRATGASAITRWLSFPCDESTLREYVLARLLHPAALPATPQELELEHALAREAIRLALVAPGSRLAGMRPMDVVLGSGGVLANAPHPALSTLILLDALQPRGITSLVIDSGHIAPALGSVATFASAAATELAESDAVPLLLGSVISVVGSVAPGELALRAVLEYADGRQRTADVLAGTLARLPLGPGERALLALYPTAEVDIGLGPGQHARASEPVEGGALGLVIDARGRPLALPPDDAQRMRLLAEWRGALLGEGHP